MYILTQDLDNDLIRDEVHSGVVGRSLHLAEPPTPIPVPTQLIRKSLTLSEPSYSIPRPNLSISELNATELNSGDGLGNTTEPVNEEQFPSEPLPGDLSTGGGYGGGGMIPEEEEVVSEEGVMRKEECKVMNINCKLFYGGLIVLGGIGAYLYFKNKK